MNYIDLKEGMELMLYFLAQRVLQHGRQTGAT